ncbi:MAG: MBOAT family protein, partial [Lachnospiraceae bacterium]|nr:MBOAT family protein [Lachnospiraceae bacterium]
MVFSSGIFLFFFLPIVYLLYCICPNLKFKNALLILASLFFYAFGEPIYIFLMIGSIFVNYCLARLISASQQWAKTALVLAVVFNIGLLAVFKYSAVFVESVGGLFGLSFAVPEIALPIGISFYTFQALSYCIDVYRDRDTVQKNVWKLMLYISFFPQLIAGPIVKYHDIEAQLSDRRVTITDAALGIRRFICGLAKKLL